jgi:tripartite-type tricarboxylate transporter receptor subunit TctC
MMRVFYLLVFILFLLSPQVARSQDKGAAEARAFYKGKTIIWQVGSTPGASTGLLARLLVPYWAEYTGARVIVQNRPGGGGIAMFNYLYKRGKPDGLTVGWHLASTQLLGRIVGRSGIQFKVEDLSWVGVVSPIVNTFVANANKFKSLDDLKKSDRPLRWGLTRPGGNSHFMGATLAKVLDLNVQIVSGYPGTPAVRQALLSGEVDVTAFPPTLFESQIKEGLVVPLIHMGQKRHPVIPDVPTIFEVVKEIPSPLDSWVNIGRVGYFMAGPPKIPENRLQFLRVTLKQAASHPELLQKAAKRKIVIDYLAPEDAQSISLKFLQMSDKNKALLKKMMDVRKKPF